MAVKAKRTEYAVAIEGDRVTAEGCTPLDASEEWTPEHLVLAALARCCIGSLRYNARRRSLTLSGRAETSGAVSQRDDGSWGFVEITCRADVELDPPPPPDELRELLERAERGCFIGGSLRPKPTYAWRVNGEPV